MRPPRIAQFARPGPQLTSGALKAGNAVLLALTSIIMARLIGPTGFGTYAYGMAIAIILGVPGSLGMDRFLVREVAIAKEGEQAETLRGLWRWANRAVVLACGLLAAGLLLVVTFAVTPLTLVDAAIIVAIVPLFSLLRVRRGFIIGAGKPIWGQVPELAVQHAVTYTLVTLAILSRHSLSYTSALAIAAVAAAAGVVAGSLIVRYYALSPQGPGRSAVFGAVWLRSALPMALIAGLWIVNSRIDLIMVGTILGVRPAGIYEASTRIPDILYIVSYAVTTPNAPILAQHFAAHRHSAGRQLFQSMRKRIAVAIIPSSALMLVLAPLLLQLYGPAFADGATVLRILTVAIVLDALVGPVGMALMMTGWESYVAAAALAGVVSNVLLNAMLLPVMGIEGAAIATGMAIVIRNGIMFGVLARSWRRDGPAPARLH